jgi:hypothetical protein
MPNFNGNGGGGEKDRRRALDRLPEKMKDEQKAVDRKAADRKLAKDGPLQPFEPRCKVCTHPNRRWIERMILEGHTDSAIERSFSDDPNNSCPRRSVANHREKGHMGIQEAAIRAIIEEEARLEGRHFEEGVRDVLSKKAMFEVMMRQAYKDAVVDKVTTIEPRDMIQMAKIIGEWEQGAATAAVEEARMQMQIMLQAIKNIFGPAEQIQLGREIKRLRKMDGIAIEVEAEFEEPKQLEYVDATVQDSN